MPRYVILWHEMPRGGDRVSHYDVMLEEHGVLRTYEVLSEPCVGETTAARRLPDHRMEYLTHTGPVSGNRGHVTRYDQGTYSIAKETPDEIVLRLSGERLRGEWTLRVLSLGESAQAGSQR